MTELINLTPHPIVLLGEDNIRLMTLEPSGEMARCSVEKQKVSEANINGLLIPINKSEFGQVENLPEPQDNTYYIVSMLVAKSLKGQRDDLLIVDDTVRDDNGNIIGCQSFAFV